MVAIGSRILITSVASALNLCVTSLSSCPVFVTRRHFAVGRVSFATDTLLKRVCVRREETATEANGFADFGRAQRTSSVGGRAQLSLGSATGHLLRAEWQNRRAATRPCKMRQIRTVSCTSLVHHV